MTDGEIEEVLFEEDVVKAPSPVNFPTIAGLGLLGLGMIHLVNTLLGGGFSVGFLNFLAVTGGLLALLIGMSNSKPKKSRKSKRRKRMMAARKRVRDHSKGRSADSTFPRRRRGTGLYKSKDQKVVFGVCGGLAERTDIEVALIRIAFVAATFLGFGAVGIVSYIVLALSMQDPE